jgi:superfamily II DNA or RNA helicase
VSPAGPVDLDGQVVFRAADPPRAAVLEVGGDPVPWRTALPVLAAAHRRDDLPAPVRQLGAAVVLGLRLVAEGRVVPADGVAGPHWRIGDLADDDRRRVADVVSLADDGDDGDSHTRVAAVLDAVADVLPRSAPATVGRAWPLTTRLEAHRRGAGAETPHLVTLSLRVEADEEELVAGAVRLVLQVHDERDPLHLSDAAELWTGTHATHGFGERARVHATIALRAAAEAWPVLDRLLEMAVPDQIVLDTDELVSLLDEGVGALRRRGVDVLWPRSLGRDLTTTTVLDHRPGGSAGPREEPLVEGLLGTDSLFAFRWQVALHGDPLSAAEMDRLAAATSPLLRLRGQWMVVDPAVAQRAKKRLVRTVSPVQAVAAALTGVAEVDPGSGADHDVVVGASLLKVRELLRTAATRTPVEQPEGLQATLRDYQRHGLTWLAQLTELGLGACLADDMGLGKTVTLIALHLHRGGGPTLVVCPASLLGTWEHEIRRFAPGVAVRRYHGAQRDLAGAGSGGFVLTTYGTMRTSPGLRDVPWDLVVADEAQHVKNPRSSTARALRTIESRARVALTGTPVENDLTELWAILDWAIPGLLGSRQAFRKVWAGPIESGLEPTKARRFAELVGPFLLRRRKSDPGVAPELPPKTETDHELELTREQVVLYESFVRDTMVRIERADPRDDATRRGLVLALLTGLKQICNHPAQFLKQASPRLAGRSPKLEAVDELVSTVLSEGGAVLVFTQYVAMARLLETHLTRTGVAHQFLHGGTPVRDREAMVARFQAGEVPVFVLSLRAGGTGLTLTRADHVIHLDRWWNPAVEDQATDRAYRIGQTRPVQVHRLITRGTIEERIAELLVRKRALADSVLARDDDDVADLSGITELDDAELRDLVTYRELR